MFYHLLLGLQYQFNILRTLVNTGLIRMNFFKQEASTSTRPDREEIALLSTRIYVVILAIAMAILSFLNGSDLITVSKIVSSPSLATFEQLQVTYPLTLVCYCRENTLSYDKFMSVKMSFHQVSCADLRYLNGCIHMLSM
jgi:hypothetical protein